jgi:DNA-binding NarL/FixJ family response regulator
VADGSANDISLERVRGGMQWPCYCNGVGGFRGLIPAFIMSCSDAEFTAPAMGIPESGTTIRVLVVDDHPPMRFGLVALIKSQAGMDVVAEASDGEEAIEVYDDVRPDVVLMDLRMPGMGGVEAILAIRKKHPEARVIVLSTYDLDEDIHRALQSGAQSYLLKDMPSEEISSTIRVVYAGDALLPRQVAERLTERAEREQLTERERDVLEALIKGRSNKEIASSLCISEDTVKSHLKALFTKLRVRDRTGAAVEAIRHGIIHLK